MNQILTTDAFDKCYGELGDRVTRIKIQSRIDRAQRGNFGDHRSVGKGIAEMRITHGPGYRIYDTIRAADLVILLAGGNKWNSAQHLHTKEDMALYLATCIEEAEDDTAFIIESLAIVARAQSMMQPADEPILNHEDLIHSLSGDANPSFATIIKVMRALGLQLQVAPMKEENAA